MEKKGPEGKKVSGGPLVLGGRDVYGQSLLQLMTLYFISHRTTVDHSSVDTLRQAHTHYQTATKY